MGRGGNRLSGRSCWGAAREHEDIRAGPAGAWPGWGSPSGGGLPALPTLNPTPGPPLPGRGPQEAGVGPHGSPLLATGEAQVWGQTAGPPHLPERPPRPGTAARGGGGCRPRRWGGTGNPTLTRRRELCSYTGTPRPHSRMHGYVPSHAASPCVQTRVHAHTRTGPWAPRQGVQSERRAAPPSRLHLTSGGEGAGPPRPSAHRGGRLTHSSPHTQTWMHLASCLDAACCPNAPRSAARFPTRRSEGPSVPQTLGSRGWRPLGTPPAHIFTLHPGNAGDEQAVGPPGAGPGHSVSPTATLQPWPRAHSGAGLLPKVTHSAGGSWP